jgi:cell division protein FtsZ
MRSEEKSECCIVGVGGAGTSIVNRVHASNISGIDCIVANTEFASLRNRPVSRQIQLGNGGRGPDGCAAYGKDAAWRSCPQIRSALEGYSLVCVVAGLGGGTGTGASPVVALLALESGACVAIAVTVPFEFEGEARERTATEGLKFLKGISDKMLVFDNDVYFRENIPFQTLIDRMNSNISKLLPKWIRFLIEKSVQGRQ